MKQKHKINRRVHGRIKRARHRCDSPGYGPYVSYKSLDLLPSSKRDSILRMAGSGIQVSAQALTNIISAMMTPLLVRGKSRGAKN